MEQLSQGQGGMQEGATPTVAGDTALDRLDCERGRGAFRLGPAEPGRVLAAAVGEGWWGEGEV